MLYKLAMACKQQSETRSGKILVASSVIHYRDDRGTELATSILGSLVEWCEPGKAVGGGW